MWLTATPVLHITRGFTIVRYMLAAHTTHKNFFADVLLWKAGWGIPDDINVKNMISHDNKNSKIAGHFGIYMTVERLKHNYHWHRMEEDVKDYVRACDTCQQDKPSCHCRYGQS